MGDHNTCGACCNGGMQNCGGCYHGFCGGSHGALRWVIGIIILTIIFVMGIKVGELKSELRQYYGGYGEYPMMQRGGMMYDWTSQATPPTTIVPKAAK